MRYTSELDLFCKALLLRIRKFYSVYDTAKFNVLVYDSYETPTLFLANLSAHDYSKPDVSKVVYE